MGFGPRRGSNSSQIAGSSASNAHSSAADEFAHPNGVNMGLITTDTAPLRLRVTRPGTLQNLRVRTTAAVGGTTGLVVTVRVNGSPSALAVTVTNANGTTEQTNVANVVNVVAGDEVLIHYVVDAVTIFGFGWTFDYAST